MVKRADLKLFLVLFLSRIAILVLPILFWQASGKADIQISNFLGLWTRWDAPHFIYIAQQGYTNIGDPANFIVFPPLYPLTIKIASLILFNFEFSAILVSITCFSFSGILFYKITSKIWDKEIAKKSLFLLCIFPTTYFFTAPYTESLFWLVSMLAIWFSLKRNWILAGVFAGLSFLTRFPAILLLPTLWLLIIKEKPQIYKNLLFVTLLTSIFVFLYLFINFQVYGDWFAFRTILIDHWQKTFAFPWISIKNSWHAAQGLDDYALQVGWWEALPATAGVILIPFVFKYLKNTVWSIWYTLNIILITSTSFLLSTPRYLLAIPPLFVFLAIISKNFRVIYYAWIFISAGLLTYFSLRFVTGAWSF